MADIQGYVISDPFLFEEAQSFETPKEVINYLPTELDQDKARADITRLLQRQLASEMAVMLADGTRPVLYLSEAGRLCQYGNPARTKGFLFPCNSTIRTLAYRPALTATQAILSEIQHNIEINLRYHEHAAISTFTNAFIKQCLKSDLLLAPCMNGISRGNRKDGDVIRVRTIVNALEKQDKSLATQFAHAVDSKVDFSSGCFRLLGYEAQVSLVLHSLAEDDQIEFSGTLHLHHKATNKSFTFVLINDSHFIFYDKHHYAMNF